MLKSPEEYLSSMNFNAEAPDGSSKQLDVGERAFIEKYLGLDALEKMPVQDPEPLPLPKPAPAPAARVLLKEPEIIVAAPHAEPPAATRATVATRLPPIVIAPENANSSAGEAQLQSNTTNSDATAPELAPAPRQDVPHAPPASKPVLEKAEVAATEERHTTAPIVAPVTSADRISIKDQAIAPARTPERLASPVLPDLSPEVKLREKMRQAAEIQVVSFFVANQLFLLPVAGIQEVVRHMELIKVPQAPDFIAGAINLRGTVMPLVRLSSLLTNEPHLPYDKKNFVIITGSERLRMGLIIDKVSSMHMIPQNKIIWNAEAKLGDAAEFLSAIVDLDDRVCGMVAPDTIVQKILPELGPI